MDTDTANKSSCSDEIEPSQDQKVEKDLKLEKSDDSDENNIQFRCASCDHHEIVHYFGKTPPFVYGIEFCESTYVMRDPFQPPITKWKSKAEYFIAIGAPCIRCKDMVCKDNGCHFFYKNTYCLPCAKTVVSSFPQDMQLKLRKQLAT